MDIQQKNFGDKQTVINNESGIVNINQNIQYTDLIGEDSLHVYKEIPQTEQDKFVWRFIITFLLSGISLIADLLQIHPMINLPLWVYIIVFSFIVMIVVVNYYDNYKIFIFGYISEKVCYQLYSDKLFQRSEDGYVIFTYSNNCIYPGCTGKIKISSRPERYNGNYSFFGTCTLADKQHSYGIDYNFKAYPIDVDWRSIPVPDK